MTTYKAVGVRLHVDLLDVAEHDEQILNDAFALITELVLGHIIAARGCLRQHTIDSCCSDTLAR